MLKFGGAGIKKARSGLESRPDFLEGNKAAEEGVAVLFNLLFLPYPMGLNIGAIDLSSSITAQ